MKPISFKGAEECVLTEEVAEMVRREDEFTEVQADMMYAKLEEEGWLVEETTQAEDESHCLPWTPTVNKEVNKL